MPINKRKRTQSPAAGQRDSHSSSSANSNADTADVYERSVEFYFDDGNIVLVAEKTAFRIHRGQMARHSPIFRDMFAVVQQPDGAETFDGCPLVKLSDQSVDLSRFLSALYDITRLDFDHWAELFSLLRMAHKYMIDDLRDYACDTLGITYPRSLAQWDTYSGSSRAPATQVISLARKTGATILLPAAFYRLCTLPSSVAMQDPDMTKQDLSNLFTGKKTIAGLWGEILGELLNRVCRDENCSEKWMEHTGLLHHEMLASSNFTSPDTLERLQEFGSFAVESELCRVCREYARDVVADRRRKLWENLPQIFGLGSWGELRKH